MIKKLSVLQPYSDRYTAMEFQPLVITATLKQALIMYDPVYLDNLLARAVIEHARVNTFEMEKSLSYELPVPLKRLWTSEDGFPLWAASVFMPIGKVVRDTVYLHKRLGRFEFSDKQPKSNVGRWMDRRVPKPAMQSESKQWRAVCVGNADEIMQLLPLIRLMGKHRNVGYGEIAEWDVSAWDGDDIQTIVQNEKLVHAIPQGAESFLGLQFDDPASLVGWTCPQWKPDIFSLGWRVGSSARLPTQREPNCATSRLA